MMFRDKQVSAFIRVFWRGCKYVVQLWAMLDNGCSYLIFERWAYVKKVFNIIIKTRVHLLEVYLSGYKYDHNRGRHWDRKRK